MEKNEKIEDFYNVEMWEKIGFLTGLKDETKNKCATFFGNAAEYITNNFERVEVVIFPIIRKLVQEYNVETINMKKIIKIMFDVFTDLENDKNYLNLNRAEKDGEVCIEVVNRYINDEFIKPCTSIKDK